MSEPTDIKALDEYLKGGSDVSQRYRELGRDEVSAELDRRVLAAARDAIAGEGAKRSRSWLRWSAPVALAASVVLVVTVVLERGVQDQTVVVPQAANVRPVRSDGVSDDKAANAVEERKLAKEPAPVYVQTIPDSVRAAMPEVTVPFEPAPAESLTKAEAEPPVVPLPPVVAETQAQRDQALAGSVATVQPQPAAAPPEPAVVGQISATKSLERGEAEADSSADVPEAAVSGSRTRRATGRTAGPRNTISGSALSGSESRPATDEPGQHSDPQAWLEDIREMRRAGKTAEADREWERFREAFPDFHVEDDDIARKKP